MMPTLYMYRQHSSRRTVARHICFLLAGLLLTGRGSAQAPPPSVILVVADGMGSGQHALAYYFTENYPLGRFEHVGLMTTHPIPRDHVTDSGAAATAMATGHKAKSGVISLDTNGKRLETALEVAEARGMVTGIVTTASITDATPAAFASHQPSRRNHAQIAREMTSAGVELLLGGGSRYFDADHLLELEGRGVQVISDLAGPLDIARPLLGLFAPGEMQTLPDRKPTLYDMVTLALERLAPHPGGFFLVIEDEGVDTESHAHRTEGVLKALDDLMRTMDLLLDYQASHPDILLMFMGDHETGGLIFDQRRNRPGKLKWTTGVHTGNLVPVFASGPGSAAVDGIVDNTDIGKLLINRFLPKP